MIIDKIGYICLNWWPTSWSYEEKLALWIEKVMTRLKTVTYTETQSFTHNGTTNEGRSVQNKAGLKWLNIEIRFDSITQISQHISDKESWIDFDWYVGSLLLSLHLQQTRQKHAVNVILPFPFFPP